MSPAMRALDVTLSALGILGTLAMVSLIVYSALVLLVDWLKRRRGQKRSAECIEFVMNEPICRMQREKQANYGATPSKPKRAA